MTSKTNPTLRKLSDSGPEVSPPAEDIRDRRVKDIEPNRHPLLHTLYGPFTAETSDFCRHRAAKAPTIAISNSQRATAPPECRSPPSSPTPTDVRDWPWQPGGLGVESSPSVDCLSPVEDRPRGLAQWCVGSVPGSSSAALFYIRTVRCDFHVEGSDVHWSDNLEDQPEIGDPIEHRRKSYTVIDVTALGHLLLVTVRPRLDEAALV